MTVNNLESKVYEHLESLELDLLLSDGFSPLHPRERHGLEGLERWSMVY